MERGKPLMKSLTLTCEDCGGTGVDPGSLYEPEGCTACLGGGKIHFELDTPNSHYGIRKPVTSVACIGNGLFVRVRKEKGR
jgi:DnaJ-class molecular chaperone